ncbi:MAG: nitroreductase family deazaflavin-dependent oxidoreductase [Anaerolineales bacterium]|nr:nitroreductase family deazaflavin-dependent oxidoreductase [Anaerolineales bacterium]
MLKIIPQVVYKLGLGPIIGRRVLLLTTTGRKSGLPRVTPLQYEEINGAFFVGSMRGKKADWFRNILEDPRVNLRVGRRRFDAIAEPVSDPDRITDFLEERIARHPRIMAMILRAEGVSVNATRDQLRDYAEDLAMIVIHPPKSRLDT